jgi:hypothetical protein
MQNLESYQTKELQKLSKKSKNCAKNHPKSLPKFHKVIPLNPTVMLFRILEAPVALQRGSKLKNYVSTETLVIYIFAFYHYPRGLFHPFWVQGIFSRLHHWF